MAIPPNNFGLLMQGRVRSPQQRNAPPTVRFGTASGRDLSPAELERLGEAYRHNQEVTRRWAFHQAQVQSQPSPNGVVPSPPPASVRVTSPSITHEPLVANPLHSHRATSHINLPYDNTPYRTANATPIPPHPQPEQLPVIPPTPVSASLHSHRSARPSQNEPAPGPPGSVPASLTAQSPSRRPGLSATPIGIRGVDPPQPRSRRQQQLPNAISMTAYSPEWVDGRISPNAYFTVPGEEHLTLPGMRERHYLSQGILPPAITGRWFPKQ
jgi:hypothetical protein